MSENTEGSYEEKFVATKLQQEADRCITGVMDVLRMAKISDHCYAYKVRSKSDSRLMEKCSIKQKEKADYSLRDITDVLGLRLVYLFIDDMLDGFTRIAESIAHKGRYPKNVFKEGSPEEIIVYVGNNAVSEVHSSVVSRANDIFGDDIKIDKRESGEGYSSIHIVTRLDVSSQDMFESGDDPQDKLGKDYYLPIEIQIRTVFEDAWGEIDHQYGYTIRKGKTQLQPVHNREQVNRHLKVLKRFADGCMEYAQVIRELATSPPRDANKFSSPVESVDPDEALVAKFKGLRVENKLIVMYTEGRKLKSEASEIERVAGDEGKIHEKYLEAAEVFSDLSDEARRLQGPEARKQLYYYSRMNEAVCLMAAGRFAGGDHAKTALGIYHSLKETYSDYPLLFMRMGQAYGRLGNTEKAIESLKRARDIAKEVVSGGGKEAEAWPENFPKVDYEHFSLAQPKLLGYYLWQESMNKSPEEKARLLLEAYESTLSSSGAPGKDGDVDILNNLLYYAMGYVSTMVAIEGGSKVNKGRSSNKVMEMNARVREHIKEIQQKVDLDGMDVETLDTIQKAFCLLGDKDNAREAAKKLLNKVTDKNIVIGRNTDMILDLYRTAWEIYNGKEWVYSD